MLVFCLGTAAELIKCYPVIDIATQRGIRWCVVSTGQSPNLLKMQFEDFGLSGKGDYHVLIPTRRDLDRPLQALAWFFKLLTVSRKTLIARMGIPPSVFAPENIWIVHGDTLSTLGGALLGRRLGLRVAHIEAGMRSGTWWSPFPEEVTRRWVSRLARIHYAPNSNAARALRDEKVRGTIVETCGNTQLDALIAIRDEAVQADVPSGDYGVANLHRFENLNRGESWRRLVDATLRLSRHCPIHFVMHPQTRAKLDSEPETRQRLENAGVLLVDRLPFIQFSRLLKHAKFLLSDGGGNQDESRVLGLPCLILRTHTESPSGLAPEGPCLLSELKEEKIIEFDRDPQGFRRSPYTPELRPSEQIIASLLSFGVVKSGVIEGEVSQDGKVAMENGR